MNKESILVSDLLAHVVTHLGQYLQGSSCYLIPAGAERCGQVSADTIGRMLRIQRIQVAGVRLRIGLS